MNGIANATGPDRSRCVPSTISVPDTPAANERELQTAGAAMAVLALRIERRLRLMRVSVVGWAAKKCRGRSP